MTIGKRDCLLYPAHHKLCVLNPDTRPLRHREVTWLIQGHIDGGPEARPPSTWAVWSPRTKRMEEEMPPLPASWPSLLSPPATSFLCCPQPTVEMGPRDPASLPYLLPGSRMRAPPRQGSLFSSLGCPELLGLRLTHSRHATDELAEVSE